MGDEKPAVLRVCPPSPSEVRVTVNGVEYWQVDELDFDRLPDPPPPRGVRLGDQFFVEGVPYGTFEEAMLAAEGLRVNPGSLDVSVPGGPVPATGNRRERRASRAEQRRRDKRRWRGR